mmetsp:Transcript_17298/g.39164  ORF Transcript_17298/g.39164 Transcript_17298/m.39164 type:complete len:215 (-) Transcript_17298:237-881(-)
MCCSLKCSCVAACCFSPCTRRSFSMFWRALSICSWSLALSALAASFAFILDLLAAASCCLILSTMVSPSRLITSWSFMPTPSAVSPDISCAPLNMKLTLAASSGVNARRWVTASIRTLKCVLLRNLTGNSLPAGSCIVRRYCSPNFSRLLSSFTCFSSACCVLRSSAWAGDSAGSDISGCSRRCTSCRSARWRIFCSSYAFTFQGSRVLIWFIL